MNLKDTTRAVILDKHTQALSDMLEEKVKNYGAKGGFYDANSKGNYQHALGEAKLKIGEYQRTGNIRHLIKASTWLYLIFETEVEGGIL